jgi:glycosyltransferase involved in cell wall biosynthesis
MNERRPRKSRNGLATPKLSVVMPVHDVLPHLDQAVESILEQTFSEFEFVILDDASTDGSTERLREWASRDPRIRLLRSDINLGPVGSSNMVANAATAPIVARMDADDVADGERLEEQFNAFEQYPEVGVVGTLSNMIDASGRLLRAPEAWRVSHKSPFVPFAHGAMMYRRSLFEQIGGYREECAYWEDQDLVVRMAERAPVLVIPRPLYSVRAWTQSTRLTSNRDAIEHALDRMYAATDRLREQRSYGQVEDFPLSEKVRPRVFIPLGSVPLWAGERPRLFGRLLKRGKLRLNAETMFALVWTGWASLSPGSLRRFLTLLLRIRNKRSSDIGASGDPIPWAPFSGGQSSLKPGNDDQSSQ